MSRSSTALTIVAAAALGLLAAAFLTQWLVVDVHPNGRDGFTLALPLPLIRAVVALIPGELYEDTAVPEELAAHREAIIEALAALRDCPDVTLVAVRSADARISVAKRGRLLQVKVDSSPGQPAVRCNLPLDGLVKVLDRWEWETVEPGVFLGILAEAPRGPLVNVTAPDATVSLAIR